MGLFVAPVLDRHAVFFAAHWDVVKDDVRHLVDKVGQLSGDILEVGLFLGEVSLELLTFRY